nr:hypothetical protein GCM10010200_070290 [Actinomadura rugatobispora]
MKRAARARSAAAPSAACDDSNASDVWDASGVGSIVSTMLPCVNDRKIGPAAARPGVRGRAARPAGLASAARARRTGRGRSGRPPAAQGIRSYAGVVRNSEYSSASVTSLNSATAWL